MGAGINTPDILNSSVSPLKPSIDEANLRFVPSHGSASSGDDRLEETCPFLVGVVLRGMTDHIFNIPPLSATLRAWVGEIHASARFADEALLSWPVITGS
jgi:hypothetical protein